MSARKSREGNSFVYEHHTRVLHVLALAASPYLEQLTHRHFHVLLALAAYGTPDGENVCPSVERIARETRYNRTTVMQTFAELEAAGVLTRTKGTRQTKKTYRFSLPTNSAEDFARTMLSTGSVGTTDTEEDGETDEVSELPTPASVGTTDSEVSDLGQPVSEVAVASVGTSSFQCRNHRHKPINEPTSQPILEPIKRTNAEQNVFTSVDSDVPATEDELRQFFAGV